MKDLPQKPKRFRGIWEDRLHEECAVFGIYGHVDAARLTYFGLYALQHRGQESSGISASNGQNIVTHKAMGLVTHVYNEENLGTLKGSMAIGHNRYSTHAGSFFEHTQPVTGKKNILAFAHNGNLPQTKSLKAFLLSKNFQKDYLDTLSDSRLMHHAIESYLEKGLSLEDSVRQALPLFTGAYCFLAMTKDKIAVVRDSYGIRPFSIGTLNGGYVFSSETCAIDTVSGEFIRDVKPGEMIIVSEKGFESHQLFPSNQKLDIFEFVYFSRPDSILLGKGVYEVRKRLGEELAKERPIQADVVMPVPDSAIPAATGYAIASGIPLELGLIKNRYVGRTFILPDQRLRDSVHAKLNPIKEVMKGKKVVVIDDSIVRGTITKKLTHLIRGAGAKEVHLLISSPPIRYPDFYGIDTPIQSGLIAANKSISQIEEYTQADSLYYLSYKGLIRATGLSESVFCTSCFTGEYPIDIGENKKNIKKIPT